MKHVGVHIDIPSDRYQSPRVESRKSAVFAQARNERGSTVSAKAKHSPSASGSYGVVHACLLCLLSLIALKGQSDAESPRWCVSMKAILRRGLGKTKNSPMILHATPPQSDKTSVWPSLGDFEVKIVAL